ncbi:MAG: flavodoxin [Syntrophomonadaceae bacterium]|nr:flavodoxin [Syntrophomonadaceae bacterium]
MKKLFVIVAGFLLLFALPACGNAEPASNAEQSAEPPNATEQTLESDEAETETSKIPKAAEQKEADTMKSLVVYFSWSGNTRSVAKEIQQQTGADIFEIVPETPYTDNYDELLDIAQNEKRGNARPAISSSPGDLDEYAIIYLGYPNWWADMPMVIYTFIDDYDLSGKTIAPFCTSGGSGFSGSVGTIKSMEPDAEILDGLHVRDSGAANPGSAVTDWLGKLNLAG